MFTYVCFLFLLQGKAYRHPHKYPACLVFPRGHIRYPNLSLLTSQIDCLLSQIHVREPMFTNTCSQIYTQNHAKYGGMRLCPFLDPESRKHEGTRMCDTEQSFFL